MSNNLQLQLIYCVSICVRDNSHLPEISTKIIWKMEQKSRLGDIKKQRELGVEMVLYE